MNLTIIPFHDWRKSESEGFRTRDGHFIKALKANLNVEKILIINRPSTILELFYKKQKRKIKGDLLLKNKGFSLTKIDSKIFVVDYFSTNIIGQFLKRHLWFIEKYADKHYLSFINNSCQLLKITNHNLITNNVFSYKLAAKISADRKLFDAWDNFLKFPDYINIKTELVKGYKSLSKNVEFWTTNSQENINFFKKNFNVKNISLIKNGVNEKFLPELIEAPESMKDIKRPIIGYGGKISYLLNHELINYITSDNPDFSFVFVGQILDKEVYKKIVKRDNVIFLGDKHYDVYPNYVANFDVCIIPYNINEGQHGGDSIKAYEYLLTGKKVVGTKGNGLIDLKKHIYLVDDEREFSFELKNQINEKSPINIKDHSWESKAELLVQVLKKA